MKNPDPGSLVKRKRYSIHLTTHKEPFFSHLVSFEDILLITKKVPITSIVPTQEISFFTLILFHPEDGLLEWLGTQNDFFGNWEIVE